MKKLVGSDIGSYGFDPVNKLVTFNNCGNISLSNILLITNVTAHTIIYNFADSNTTGTLAGNVLTLAYNTTAMGANDVLQIYLDLPVQSTLFSTDDLYRMMEANYVSTTMLRQLLVDYSDKLLNIMQLYSGEQGNRMSVGQSGMTDYLYDEIK